MSTPANALAAPYYAKIDEAAKAYPHLSQDHFGYTMVRADVAKLTIRDLAMQLAPTLDALAAAQAENQLRRNELVEVAVKKRQFQDLLAKAEADCAALRDLLHRAQAWVAEDTPLQDLIATALQATDAGKPLLDELAKLRECVGVRGDSQTADFDHIEYTRLRERAEAAESAMRLAQEDRERLDWLEKAGKGALSPLWAQDWIHLRSAIDAARKEQP